MYETTVPGGDDYTGDPSGQWTTTTLTELSCNGGEHNPYIRPLAASPGII
jgi:hypothetical protein